MERTENMVKNVGIWSVPNSQRTEKWRHNDMVTIIWEQMLALIGAVAVRVRVQYLAESTMPTNKPFVADVP